jgi:ABC-type phosphate transport system ATPase subunit
MLNPLILRNLRRVKVMTRRITNMCNLDERSTSCTTLINEKWRRREEKVEGEIRGELRKIRSKLDDGLRCNDYFKMIFSNLLQSTKTIYDVLTALAHENHAKEDESMMNNEAEKKLHSSTSFSDLKSKTEIMNSMSARAFTGSSYD